MDDPGPLESALRRAHATRAKKGIPFTDLLTPIPSFAPDLFSNDYLSITTNPQLRLEFLKRIRSSSKLFSPRGARVVAGNTQEHIELEARLRQHFNAPAALLFNSGYDANVAFFGSVPQEGDAILFDELVHASCRDGIASSRACRTAYPFPHNSVAGLETVLTHVLHMQPRILEGQATLFVAVESLYSMDGDFYPLQDILFLLRQRIPTDCLHVVIDEAHSTGIYGPQGRGLVAELGLQDYVQTGLHTLGKARGVAGAVLLTSPAIRTYLINYARSFIYSTALPHVNLVAIECSLSVIEGPLGDQLREQLLNLSKLFHKLLYNTVLGLVPSGLLRLPESHVTPGALPFQTPIFPILTSRPLSLAAFLQDNGYSARPMPYPAVPRGQERIRVILHAGNTETDLRAFMQLLLQWARGQGDEDVHSQMDEPESMRTDSGLGSVEARMQAAVAARARALL
ncbi:aminotransferase [Gloeopeniophorella convolvens]|nr:aminotransferase [Gloeopeniophorella convolvens]